MSEIQFAEKIDVHNYEKRVRQQEQLLKDVDILEENREQIKKFTTFCKADPKVGLSRIRLYLYTLRNLAIFVGKKSFKKMDKDDVIELVSKISEHKYIPVKLMNSFKKDCAMQGITGDEYAKVEKELLEKHGKPYSPNTVEDYLKSIKKFWRYMYDTGKDDPPQTKWLCTRANKTNEEPKIFTKSEIDKIIDGCNSVRDKAFFSCLYDLGCRVSELLTRQMKHVGHDEEDDFQILVDSTKNGRKHQEALYNSVPFLTTWLKMHPFSDDKNAPLWITDGRHGNENRQLTYDNARKIFNTICDKQKIKVGETRTMHMIRKSKATHDIMDGVPISLIILPGIDKIPPG